MPLTNGYYWPRLCENVNSHKAVVNHYRFSLKSNKNDRNDAEAICEAVQRPSMRFVQPKQPEQQAILHLHHGRRLFVRQRVALSNHMRGVLSEYGIVVPQGVKVLSRRLPELLEDAENDLPMLVRHLLAALKAEHDQLNERIAQIEHQLKAWHAGSRASQRLASIPGIGVLTASALAATVGDGQNFKNGRQLAAYLGLVPRQSSSGGKERLLGISKRGDGYLRSLLIHGARAVIHHIRRRLKAGRPGGNPWWSSCYSAVMSMRWRLRWPIKWHELPGSY